VAAALSGERSLTGCNTMRPSGPPCLSLQPLSPWCSLSTPPLGGGVSSSTLPCHTKQSLMENCSHTFNTLQLVGWAAKLMSFLASLLLPQQPPSLLSLGVSP
jgi:hypothetical protein